MAVISINFYPTDFFYSKIGRLQGLGHHDHIRNICYHTNHYSLLEKNFCPKKIYSNKNVKFSWLMGLVKFVKKKKAIFVGHDRRKIFPTNNLDRRKFNPDFFVQYDNRKQARI